MHKHAQTYTTILGRKELSDVPGSKLNIYLSLLVLIALFRDELIQNLARIFILIYLKNKL